MNTDSVIAAYLKTKTSETKRLYARGIDLFHQNIIKDIPIDKVTDEHFALYCDWLADQAKANKWAPTTQHSYAKGVRRLLHYINRNRIGSIRTDVLLEMERESLKKIPDRKYRLPKGVREFAINYHNFPLPPRKDETIYQQFVKERAFIGILESTGTRITAALKIKTIAIDWQADPVKINIIGKGDREHILRLDGRAAGYVQQWLTERDKASDYVFPAMRGDKGFMSDETGRVIIRRWINLVLGPGYDFTPHAFRHLFITLARDKYGLEKAQALVEHVSIQTTALYPESLTEIELDNIYKDIRNQ